MNRRLGWIMAAFAAVSLAHAELGWTIQTVALRDLRDASREVERLRGLGIPAFTQFTMSGGQQFVRVRLGCFDDRATAETLAGVLQGGVVNTAVAVPADASPPDDVPCVVVDVGFVKPAAWSQVSQPGEAPTFRVELAGRTAYLQYQGAGWVMSQREPPAAIPLPTEPPAWRSRTLNSEPVVVHARTGAVCPGALLAVVGSSAVVDQGNTVVACTPVESE